MISIKPEIAPSIIGQLIKNGFLIGEHNGKFYYYKDGNLWVFDSTNGGVRRTYERRLLCYVLKKFGKSLLTGRRIHSVETIRNAVVLRFEDGSSAEIQGDYYAPEVIYFDKT